MTISAFLHGVKEIFTGVHHEEEKKICKEKGRKAIRHALEIIHDNDGISIPDLDSVCSELQNELGKKIVVELRSMLYFENGRYYMPDNKSQFEVEKYLMRKI